MLRKALDSKALSARQGRGRRTGGPPPAKGPAWRAENETKTTDRSNQS